MGWHKPYARLAALALTGSLALECSAEGWLFTPELSSAQAGVGGQGVSGSGNAANGGSGASRLLAFEESFDSGVARWTPQYTWFGATGAFDDSSYGTHPDCFYAKQAVTTSSDVSGATLLSLTATAPPGGVGGKIYQCAVATTFRSFAFTYGRVEVRARVPAELGIGAGVTLFPARQADPAGWISVFDVPGFQSENAQGQPGHKGHYGYMFTASDAGGSSSDHFTWDSKVALNADFHLYALEWRPHGFTWFVDGATVGTRTLTTPSWPMYPALALAVGDAAGSTYLGTPDASTVFPARMDIDWVRVWTSS